MTYRKLLQQGTEFLERQKIADAAIDAWYLMEYVCNIDRSFFLVHGDDIIAADKRERYIQLTQERGTHAPLQYLTHRAYFMGLPFFVNEHVLIPRQDTEVLVDTVIREMPADGTVLDLGTGSGCILLSLLHERKDAAGIGADISCQALAVARRNSEDLHIQADFIQSDLFEKIIGRFDVIVSNPPYIPSDVIPELMEEVKNHEPLSALDGGLDGLEFYKQIVGRAAPYLKEQGVLAFEIGYDQGESVLQLMQKAGFCFVRIIKDLAGLDRVAIGQRP